MLTEPVARRTQSEVDPLAPTLWVRAAVTGAIAAFVSFAFLLTMLLDYPFSGELAVSNSSFKTGALSYAWIPEKPRPLDPAKVKKLSPKQLVGVLDSARFFTTIFREVGDELHGVDRKNQTTIIGKVDDDGVFRGWWCQEPGRRRLNAGEVEFRLLETPTGTKIDGRWNKETNREFAGGWDLQSVDVPEPSDMAAQFDTAPFCHPPSGPDAARAGPQPLPCRGGVALPDLDSAGAFFLDAPGARADKSDAAAKPESDPPRDPDAGTDDPATVADSTGLCLPPLILCP